MKHTKVFPEFSISGLSAGNANTVIRISKTNSANDLSELHNGPTESVEVRVEPILKPEEPEEPKLEQPEAIKVLWDSSKVWNSNPRIVKHEAGKEREKDPFDPAIDKLHGPGEMSIDGKGNATLKTYGAEGSIRIYFALPNLNTEVSGIMKTDKTLVNFNVNHRNDHAGCGFGGYQCGWSINDHQRSDLKKEIVHADYVDAVKKSFHKKVTPGETIGFKSRVENTPDGKGVRCRTWIDYTGKGTDWTALCDGIDDGKGNWVDDSDWKTSDAKKCFDEKSGFMKNRNKDTRSNPVLTVQPKIWIRLNAEPAAGNFVKDVTLSNVVIKEI